MDLTDFLNSPLGQWLIGAILTLGLARLGAEAIANFVGRWPVVGPALAGLVRSLGGELEKWLQGVQKKADVAVLAVEERYRNDVGTAESRSEAKLLEAIEILKRQAPGITDAQARVQIEAALSRMRAAGAEQKALGQ